VRAALQSALLAVAVWYLSDHGRLRLRRRLDAALSRSRWQC